MSRQRTCTRVSEKIESDNTPTEENTTAGQEGPGSAPQGGREGRRISTELRNGQEGVAPSRATEGKGAKEVARKGLTSSVGPQLPS